MDVVAEIELPPGESLNDEATRLVNASDWSVSGLPSRLMKLLASILEVTNARADIASEIIALVFSVQVPPISLPQVTPSIVNPSSLVPQSRTMLTPIVPLSMQSREGSTMFKEYVERTITRMRALPQEPPIERSRIVIPSILIHTMVCGLVGGAPDGSSLEATATFATTVP